MTWKFTRSVSFEHIQQQPSQLCHNLNKQGKTAHEFYVDICCSWRNKLQAIFGPQLRGLVPITVRVRCWLLCTSMSKTIRATNTQSAALLGLSLMCSKSYLLFFWEMLNKSTYYSPNIILLFSNYAWRTPENRDKSRKTINAQFCTIILYMYIQCQRLSGSQRLLYWSIRDASI